MAEAIDDDQCIIISTHQVKDLENLIDRITIIDEGKILFNENMESISNKLSFRFAHNPEDVATAYYSETSFGGTVVVSPNTDGEETKVDLELLYKAIVTNPETSKSFQR
jgi:ABC-2 type transport system ATP-binding protein